MNKTELYNMIQYIKDLREPLRTDEVIKLSLRSDYDLMDLVLPIDQTMNIGKNVWEVSAKILIRKGNEELIKILDNILEWTQDLNWPGSEYILRRICEFPKEVILPKIDEHLTKAENMGDIDWKHALLLAKNKILYNKEIDRVWI